MKILRTLLTIFAFTTGSAYLSAQAPDTPPSQQEQLDRGFVCINTTTTSSFLSWRLLGNDDLHTSFLVLKDGTVVGDTIRNATSGGGYQIRRNDWYRSSAGGVNR